MKAKMTLRPAKNGVPMTTAAPTPGELANVAAMLAAGFERVAGWEGTAADQAMRLWEACARKVEPENARRERLALADAMIAEGKVLIQPPTHKVPEREVKLPDSFPCEFKTFLRHVVGLRTETDRVGVFHRFSSSICSYSITIVSP